MTTPIIHTPRMLLRLLSAEDRAEFVRVQEINRAFYAPWVPQQPPDQTLDELFSQQLDRCVRGLADGTQYRFVGVLADGRIAGFFNLFQIVRFAFENAIAGWCINMEVTRQGLCTEAIGALLDFAFAPPPAGLGLHRVQANIMPGNAASIRVAEKNGFRREGLGRSYLRIADRWEDHLFYAKLADEHTPCKPPRGP